MKGIKKKLNNGKTSHVHILKDLTCKYDKLFCDFSGILRRILTDFFVENENLILKFTWNYKEHRIIKRYLNEEHSWRPDISQFKICCKATVIKVVWYWHIETYIDTQYSCLANPMDGGAW